MPHPDPRSDRWAVLEVLIGVTLLAIGALAVLWAMAINDPPERHAPITIEQQEPTIYGG